VIVRSRAPVDVFQMRTVLSIPPLTMYWLSGDTATLSTDAVCPCHIAMAGVVVRGEDAVCPCHIAMAGGVRGEDASG